MKIDYFFLTFLFSLNFLKKTLYNDTEVRLIIVQMLFKHPFAVSERQGTAECILAISL